MPALTRQHEAQSRLEAQVGLMQLGITLEQYYGDEKKIFVARYPDGKDANDYLREGRTEELKKLVYQRWGG